MPEPQQANRQSQNPGRAKAPGLRFRANPLEAVGIGLIGVGSRGKRHVTEVMATPGTELRAVCDIYTKRLDWAVKTGKERAPNIKGYKDYRELLADKDVDAIIVATPDHWHSKMTIEGAVAGKDVYVQKCLTRTIGEAKAIVKAVKDNKRVLQLGHTRRSQPIYHRMKEIYGTGLLGQVSIVNITMFRNTAEGAWIWEIEPDGGPDTIDWEEFQGNAPKRDFDADRYFRWRKYWDYGTGISGDLLSHEWDAVNFIMDLGIPSTCIASGGIYEWKDKREVPDVFNVVYDYPDKKLAVVWNCTFANSAFGISTGTEIFGKNAAIRYHYKGGYVEVYVEPESDTDLGFIEELTKEQPDIRSGKAPLYRYAEDDKLYVTSHFQNFVECVRSRAKPRCCEDHAFQEAVTAVMSVEAYKGRKMVAWDPASQTIVDAARGRAT